MKRFLVKTLGCKANSTDGQLLEVGLLARGFEATKDESAADLVIVNSCTVTDEADKQSQKMVRDIHKRNPAAKIIYTGCAAEVNPEKALKIPGVSAVLGNQNKNAGDELVEAFLAQGNFEAPVILGHVANYEELRSKHPMDREWPLPDSEFSKMSELTKAGSTFRTRAFIKIQEGCNAFCTYCIIPYGRGPSRGLPVETVIEQVQSLQKSGTKEVILTGTNIGDYPIDDLIEAVLTQTKIERLRVSSLDPTEISKKTIEMMESYEAFCPHFHVSLQHVSSKILKLMKRKYAWEQVDETLARIAQMTRKPFVGMDFITGFPGETAFDFEETVERLNALYWSRLHVFPYSEREGTPATRLPNVVPVHLRKERAKRLAKMSLERMSRVFSDVRSNFENGDHGLLKAVLLEGAVKGPDGTRNWVSGYARNYQRVIIRASDDEKALLHNQVKTIAVSKWIVDQASGEISWLGEQLT